jgi:stage II sporulation protein AA (anti-sigma F factor antagonist)
MPPDLLKVTNLPAARLVELFLPEDLDSTEFDRLNDGLATAFETGGSWVLDLTKVDYLGSAALGLFVNIRQSVQSRGGRIVLCNLSPRLMQIFKACCLERLFTITRTRDEALRALR